MIYLYAIQFMINKFYHYFYGDKEFELIYRYRSSNQKKMIGVLLILLHPYVPP